MKKPKIIHGTLLSKLNKSSCEKLIRHEQLRLKGYKFHYLIDPDLIGKYCFPHGIDPKVDRLEKFGLTNNYIADEQVTLHLLFNLSLNHTYLLILNEYIPEIKGMIFKAKKVYDSVNYFPSETKDNGGQKHSQVNFSAQIKEEYSLKIAQVLFSKKSLEKFSSLFKNQKLIYQTTELKNEFLEDAFDFTITSKSNIDFILERFRKVMRDKDFFSQRSIAKERDSSAIDRILNINIFIQEKGTPEQSKNIFLLIGDSEVTNEVIDKLKSDHKFKYPTINSEKIDVYISIQEYFAYIISIGNQSDSSKKDIVLENLKALKEADIKIREGFQNANKNKNSSLTMQELASEYPELFSSYFKQRNAFENIGLLHSRSKIYESIKDDIEFMDLPELSNFFNKIRQEEKGIITNLLEERTQILDKLVIESEINFYFVRGLDLLRDTGIFGIQKGSDIIEGSYQHLPVFFKLDIFPKEIQLQFKRILNIILLHTANNGIQIYENMKEFLDKLRNTKAREEYPLSERIIKGLLCILLPMENDADFKKRNILVYKWLKNINEEVSQKDEFKSELLYLLSWFARRVENYPESINYASIGTKLFKYDPRFYHSHLLNEICLFSEDNDINSLNPILNNTSKAELLYPNFIENHFASSKEESVTIQRKLKDCFNNNICFIYTDIAFIIRNKNPRQAEIYLRKARQYLLLLLEKGRFRESLAEYFDTEAYLLFVESFIMQDVKINKLRLSLKSINKSINLQEKKLNISKELSSKYEKRKSQIQGRLNQIK